MKLLKGLILAALLITSPAFAQTIIPGAGSSLATPVIPANGGSGVANTGNLAWNAAQTLSFTSGQTMTFPATSATIARTDASQTFSGTQTFTTQVVNGTITTNGVGASINAGGAIVAGGVFQVGGGSGAIASSTGAGRWQFGNLDAAVPVAQIITAQSVVAGTTNTAGVNTTVKGSLSTGSGVSGDIIFQTGGTGAAATVQNTATNVLVLKGATQAVQMPGLASSSSAQTGTVCWTTGGGNLTVDTTTTCLLSDMRLKKNMVPLNDNEGLPEVMALKPFSYDLKDDPMHVGRQVGLGAQQVAKVDPRLVAIYDRGPNIGTPKGVRYVQLTAVLVKAVQQQQAEIDGLRREIRQLKGSR